MGKWVGFEICGHDAYFQKAMSKCPAGTDCNQMKLCVRYAKPCDFWQEFEDGGEGRIRMTISRPNHTETICCKVGEDFEVTRSDCKKVKVSCKKESDTKLVISAVPGSAEQYHMTSEICGDVKCVTSELDGVKKTIKYRRCTGCPSQCGPAACDKSGCDMSKGCK